MTRRRAIAAVFTLSFAALIAGRASSYTIEGTVVDAQGRPVPGARVWLDRSRVARAASADGDGRFAFDGVNPGTVQLVALAEGYAIGGLEGSCIGDEDVQIVLATPWATRLRIIDSRYEPIEGARVSRLIVNDTFTVFVDDLAALGFPALRSDGDGYLGLPPLPADSFASITISHSGYADGQLPALPAGIEGLDFPLPDGVKVVGRVTNSSGDGVAGARVVVYQPRDGGIVLQAAEVLTGPEGFYTTLVPPGAYWAAARHADFAMPPPVAIEARALADDAVANLQLADPHTVAGRALDATGSPVSMARLEYHANDYVVDEAMSDVRGRFELIVPEGQGAVHVTPPQRMTTLEFPRVYLIVKSDEPAIELNAIRFRPLPEIHGTAYMADGSPAARTVIASQNLDPPLYVTTEDDGAFVILLDEMPQGPVKFTAEHALRFQRREFEIDPIGLVASEIHLREYAADAKQGGAGGPNDLSALVGRPAPELACDSWLNLPAGAESIGVAALRGKVVVLVMWAGFDFMGPGRHQLNELNAIYTAYEGVDDVQFVGIHDSSATPEEVSHFARVLNIRFPIGRDEDPYETFARYSTRQIPQLVLIDRAGAVRYFPATERLPEFIKVLRRE